MPRIPKIVLLIESSRAYGRGLLAGIASYARLHGPWSFYRRPPLYDDIDQEERITHERIERWKPDGIIMRDSRLERWSYDGFGVQDSQAHKKILNMAVPIIIASSAVEQNRVFPAIMSDCAGIGKMVAEHLLERGFRNFAYCGLDDLRWSAERGESFQENLAQAGFTVQFYRQPAEKNKRTWEAELGIMADWLRQLPKPVGVMTCNDDRAQQIIEACKLANLNVPEEIAVIGVDNDDLVCELSEPPISSVVLNAERAGYEAAELLDRLMAGEKMTGQTIWARPSRVVTRKSTDILAIEDKEVAAAIRFIRQNARKAIQVNDAVQATAISRRVLEKRFRKEIGRSIFGEIKRARTSLVARMLLETDWSVSQIALKAGFTNIDHLSRYFREEMGVRPLAYRKQNT